VVRAEPSSGGDPSERRPQLRGQRSGHGHRHHLAQGPLPHDDGSLWPGAFVNVRLQLYVEPNALVIPSAAIVTGQQGSFVFVIQPDSSAASRPVTVNRTAGDYAVVSGDIQPGDRW